MILRDARIGSRVVDLRIDGGLIAEIGDIPATDDESVDLEGRWLTPGLWDHHVHFSQWAMQSQRLDVSSAGSAAETARLIADAAGPGSPTPFVAVGFRDGLWPDSPNLAVLDAASSTPVVVVGGDLHGVWLNSAALELYGRAGNETGVLREDEAFRILGFIDSVDDRELDAWVDAAARAAAAKGVVGIVEDDRRLTEPGDQAASHDPRIVGDRLVGKASASRLQI